MFISHAAHLITPTSINVDRATGATVGTTGRGIGPTYAAKMRRTGLRMEDIINGDIEVWDTFGEVCGIIKPFICNTQNLLHTAHASGANILLEGAQGTLLDIDHGTYPFVTSSNCTIGGALTGTGLNHKAIRKVIGVAKAYTTRVGEGPFPTEQNNDIGDKLRKVGGEYGTTTGRNRRCGWLNYSDLRKACELNGVDEVVVTKLDVLDQFKMIPVGYPNGLERIQYSEWNGWNRPTKGLRDKTLLPQDALKYIQHISTITRAPVTHISTSPEREDMIVL